MAGSCFIPLCPTHLHSPNISGETILGTADAKKKYMKLLNIARRDSCILFGTFSLACRVCFFNYHSVNHSNYLRKYILYILVYFVTADWSNLTERTNDTKLVYVCAYWMCRKIIKQSKMSITEFLCKQFVRIISFFRSLNSDSFWKHMCWILLHVPCGHG